MHKEAVDELLINGLKILDISFTKTQITAFLTYLEELKKWNRAYNLTAIKTDKEIIIKHFLDSLLFGKVMPPAVQSVADIGSGAGFPGIPLKIIYTDLKMFLIEPVKKKALFLQHIGTKLNLDNIEVIDKRIEEIENLKVDAAVTRALFSIKDFIDKAGNILKQDGILVLSKGPKLEEELKEVGGENVVIKDLKLPNLNLIRHLVIVKLSGHRPESF
ncbi:MAG: 16S rRNA (guanine(527)-N(7))-methyltransferase RsmG [Nitrospirae bacterium GWC2_42_7]|nr:MAG: 16S rRNA (guanine(527)-N(7))-methyltransferase RsmG [Nitrospirae bacterium GWC2_42_7]